MSAAVGSGGRSVALAPQLIEAFMKACAADVQASLAAVDYPATGGELVEEIDGGSEIFFALCEAEWFLAEARVALSMLTFALNQSPDEAGAKAITRARRTTNRLRDSISNRIPDGFFSADYGD